MSHMIPVPDALYAQLVAIAAHMGQPVERVIETLLAQCVEHEADALPPTSRALDWDTASAEEIIVDLRTQRVEREHPVEL